MHNKLSKSIMMCRNVQLYNRASNLKVMFPSYVSKLTITESYQTKVTEFRPELWDLERMIRLCISKRLKIKLQANKINKYAVIGAKSYKTDFLTNTERVSRYSSICLTVCMRELFFDEVSWNEVFVGLASERAIGSFVFTRVDRLGYEVLAGVDEITFRRLVFLFGKLTDFFSDNSTFVSDRFLDEHFSGFLKMI